MVLPNGVDPQIFRGPIHRPKDLPTAPIVGYAGKLAERIHDGLVAAVADQLPDVHFVFIGPVLDSASVRAMRRRPNVQLLGDRAYDEVPAYLRSFDVAWIPHRVGHGESGGDPIKLYEYWAAGCQVVSTRLDGSENWVTQTHLVENADQAARTIRGLLAGEIRALPTSIPRGRTWAEIAATILEDREGPPAST
jgi:glycosyltransferase involved in cell wall biosynthesis